MPLDWITPLLLLVLVLFNGGLLVLLLKKKDSNHALESRMQELSSSLVQQAQANRTEIQGSIVQQFSLVFDQLRAQSKEQQQSIAEFGRLFKENVREFNELQKDKFQELLDKQEQLLRRTEQQLEKMRETVDEKLQKTLETRLGQSFEIVTKQLLIVQKGLGEMQQLATGVGDLKRVLSNVKSRGVLGEYQLQSILENILSPEQYALNVAVKPGSAERVEFAVKMPGSDENDAVYLPIDAKFPQETYYRLLDAYDIGDKTAVEIARSELFKAIRKAAQDISSKYIHPPHTTDFAMLFLPMESLYAEIIREPALTHALQRDFKVILTGPTTLAALLNSLQMGFRTLAIQQRSAEVWKVLGAVKLEFGKFSDLITKAQKKIFDAHSDLDNLVGTRTRVIQRKLREVEELPEEEARKLLE
jgi:DNA recombination protein RmuC